MILHIIKIYFSLILSIGVISVVIFLMGLYFILRKPRPEKKKKNSLAVSTKPDKNVVNIEASQLQDLTLIAGEDVISTQLDLARAYMETGKNQLAHTILKYVVAHGNAVQQNDAQQLMMQLTLCESP